MNTNVIMLTLIIVVMLLSQEYNQVNAGPGYGNHWQSRPIETVMYKIYGDSTEQSIWLFDNADNRDIISKIATIEGINESDIESVRVDDKHGSVIGHFLMRPRPIKGMKLWVKVKAGTYKDPGKNEKIELNQLKEEHDEAVEAYKIQTKKSVERLREQIQGKYNAKVWELQNALQEKLDEVEKDHGRFFHSHSKKRNERSNQLKEEHKKKVAELKEEQEKELKEGTDALNQELPQKIKEENEKYEKKMEKVKSKYQKTESKGNGA
ncbi:hypothetical protein DdX_19080 [Ditylenchus destructor]|uniref:Uncharacterized protein n=1 Tax=Ditylenchus destructor TaxID=166010 RepID=A0AAD4MIF2_9BILA|nr:hypothetical protein DdX_19080 [Ditylenchus destructor]